MADSSVLLEVIVEGKNIKLVQRDIEELGSSINKASAAEEKQTKKKKKNKKATDDLADSNQNYNRGQKGVAQATANGTKAFSKQRDLIGGGSSGLVGAYATLAANLFAATAAFGALRRASQIEQLTKGLTELGAASGVALQSLAMGLKEATGEAISLEQAFRSTVAITSAGLDPSSVERFGAAARNVSVALGRDLTDSLDRLTRGVTKLEPELLDELGIFVRVDEAAENFAATLGKNASQLTNFEKRLAFQNEALTQAENKFGAIGDKIDTSPYEKLAAALADLTKNFLTLINKGLEPIVKFLSQNPTALFAAIALFAGGIIRQAVGALGAFSDAGDKIAINQQRLGVRLQANLPLLNNSSKLLAEVVEELGDGAVSTEKLTKAINGQNTSLRNSQARFDAGNLTKAEYTKRQKNARKAIQFLNAAIIENTLLQASNNEQLAISNLQNGLYSQAFTALKASFDDYKTSLLLGITTQNAWNASIVVGRIVALGLGTALRFLAVGFLLVLPILGAIIAGFTLIVSIGKAVIDFFKSDATKAFEEKASSLNDTMEELANSFKEVDKFAKGQESSIASTTAQYEALGNSIDQFLKGFRELEDTGGGDFLKRTKILNDFVDSSDLLTQRVKEAAKENRIVNQQTETREMLIKRVLKAVQEEAIAARALADATKEASRQLQSFRNRSQVSTPFTEASKAVDILSTKIQEANAAGAQGVADIVTKELSKADIDFFGLGNQDTQLKAARKNIENLQKELGSALRPEDVQAFGGKGPNTGSGTSYAQRQRERAARANNIAEINERLEEARATEQQIAGDISAQVEARNQALKAADEAVFLGKSIIQQSKDELALLKNVNVNQESGIRRRAELNDEIKSQQQEINNALIAELESRTFSLGQEKEQAQVKQEINRLTAENNRLEAEKTTTAQLNVQIQKGAVNALKEEQASLKFSLDLRKRVADAAERTANASASLVEAELTLQRARAGQGLQPADQVKLAKEAAERIKTQEKESLALRIEGINLEFDLLDAQYQLLKAEFQLAKEQGKFKDSAAADNALAALNKINISTARAAAISAAEAESRAKVRKAEIDASIKVLEAERESTKMRLKAADEQSQFFRDIGLTMIANSIEESKKKEEIKRIEQDILTLKQAGLSTAAKELELAAARRNLMITQRTRREETRAQTSAGASPLTASVLGGVGGIVDQSIALKELQTRLEAITEEQTKLYEAYDSGDPALFTDEDRKRLREVNVEFMNLTNASEEALKRLPIAATNAIAAMTTQLANSLSSLGPEGEIFAPVFASFGQLLQAVGALSTSLAMLTETDIAAFKAATFDFENVSVSMAAAITSSFNAVSAGLGSIGALLQAKADMTIRKYDQMIAAEKKRDGKSKESLAKIEAIEKKKEVVKKKAFETDKKIKMAQVVMQTAAGIASTLPLFGMIPWGPPLAKALIGVIAGIGAAQLAIISSLSYQGGASSVGDGSGATPKIAIGERRNTVDLARSQSASGELGYLRGQDGMGGPENFKPAFMGAKYRAMGGATTGYVVGEQGPELFVPNTPGTVVPNSEVGMGTPVNATFNINTIDSSGVEEVLQGQRGNIIGMLRDSANSYGQPFFEEVDTNIYEPSPGARRA